ncbi:hypothetical protein H4S14_003492 [Agrobacterium vitis]|nr:hypothetical protein [Agrobacterium vitis]MBE1439727.1 hypothetical protein [Agrobacterium vitis]
MTENLPATLSDIQKIEIVTQIVNKVPAAECRDLVVFIDRLLLIREDNISTKQKIKMTISETLNFKIIWPTLKILTRELKRRLWDKSSTGLKFGFTGSLIGLGWGPDQTLVTII